MILGVGVDIAEVKRLERLMHRRPALLSQVFTADEQRIFGTTTCPLECFAAGFATKEAGFKALGQSWLESALFWTDIELLGTPFDMSPPVRLSGAAHERFLSLGGKQLLCSLSHARGLLVAQLLVLGA